MKISGRFFTVVSLACICLTPAAFANDVKDAIEAANAQFSAAAAKGDGAALAAMYSPDGQVMPASSDPIRGAEAIQKFWQGALNSGVATIGLKTIEVFGHGPTATASRHVFNECGASQKVDLDGRVKGRAARERSRHRA
jgi:uncharacterized protein (TIGR02246 family)